jgi:hypothetical protein
MPKVMNIPDDLPTAFKCPIIKGKVCPYSVESSFSLLDGDDVFEKCCPINEVGSRCEFGVQYVGKYDLEPVCEVCGKEVRTSKSLIELEPIDEAMKGIRIKNSLHPHRHFHRRCFAKAKGLDGWRRV